MFNLPRGIDSAVDRPLATARWESIESTQLLAYQGGGSLFLGAVPNANHWDRLRATYEQGAKAMEAAITGKAPIAERIDAVNTLEKKWRDSLLYECLPVGLGSDQHALLVAASRSGKGADCIVPNLCLYQGSVICVDPKGENSSTTALRRGPGRNDRENSIKGMGQTVYVFDPFGVADVPVDLRCSINPLAYLDRSSPHATVGAELIAESLVVPSAGRSSEHFDGTAQDFLKGLILYLITIFKSPTLLTLRRFLTRGDKEGWDRRCQELDDPDAKEPPAKLKRFLALNPNPVVYLLNTMAESEAFDGIVAGAAQTLLDCGPEERGGILSTARRNTAFLDTTTKEFKRALEGSDRVVDLDAFKKDSRGATLYLVIPANRMTKHGRLMRCAVSLLLERCYSDLAAPACGAPVLFVLDEFATCLGYMSIIEKAAGYAAGFGVKLWFIVQDLQQIKTLYRNSYETIVSAAGVIQIFGVSDLETTTYASKRLGDTEIIRHVANHTINDQSGTSSPSGQDRARTILSGGRMGLPGLVLSAMSARASSESVTASEAVNQQIQVTPLLRPDEIERYFSRESGAQLILIKGRLPIWALRVHYYDTSWFDGFYAKTQKPAPHTKLSKMGALRLPWRQARS